MVRPDTLLSSWFYRENSQTFTTKHDVYSGFFIAALYQVEKIFLFSYFVECFDHERYWYLSNPLGSSKISHVLFFFFFCFILLIWCNTLIYFQMWSQSYILGINPTWAWCIIIFIYAAGFGLLIFLSIFVFLLISNICLFAISLSSFGIRITLAYLSFLNKA